MICSYLKVVFSGTIFEILGCRVLLWVVFSSVEEFGREFREFASILVSRNGIPSCFLFCWRVRKGIPRVCSYFCSTERNSELFSLPLKSSERNSESFLFCGTAGNLSEITICSIYSVFPYFQPYAKVMFFMYLLLFYLFYGRVLRSTLRFD